MHLLRRRDIMRISLVRLCKDELAADDICTYAKQIEPCYSKYFTGKPSQR